MDKAKRLLELLTKRITPGLGQHHNLTVNDSGALFVTLMLGNQYIPIALDEEDLQKDIPQLVNDIIFISGVERT